MRLNHKTVKIAAFLAVFFIIIFIVFLARPPVLIVADFSFAEFYGKKRMRRETARSSLVLFRRVKPVIVADDAGDDIIQAAVERASSAPLCALFPLRFAKAAVGYREKKPAVPVVLLEGRYTEDSNPASFAIGSDTEDFFIYKTDISVDFYRAALAASILDGDKNERIAVLFDQNIQTQARDAFLKAQNDIKRPQQTSFLTSFSQFSGDQGVSCVVLAGIGADYLEKYTGIPVIFFTWMAPELIPSDVVLVFNDSPCIQAVPAVRMVQAGVKKGQIPSKILLMEGKGLGRGIVRKLRKI